MGWLKCLFGGSKGGGRRAPEPPPKPFDPFNFGGRAFDPFQFGGRGDMPQDPRRPSCQDHNPIPAPSTSWSRDAPQPPAEAWLRDRQTQRRTRKEGSFSRQPACSRRPEKPGPPPPPKDHEEGDFGRNHRPFSFDWEREPPRASFQPVPRRTQQDAPRGTSRTLSSGDRDRRPLGAPEPPRRAATSPSQASRGSFPGQRLSPGEACTLDEDEFDARLRYASSQVRQATELAYQRAANTREEPPPPQRNQGFLSRRNAQREKKRPEAPTSTLNSHTPSSSQASRGFTSAGYSTRPDPGQAIRGQRLDPNRHPAPSAQPRTHVGPAQRVRFDNPPRIQSLADVLDESPGHGTRFGAGSSGRRVGPGQGSLAQGSRPERYR